MFRFTDTAAHRFQKGMLYLGRDPKTGHDIGIATERHAIEIAGARSGKGAASIIPNCLRWPDNLLCVDPSGENVEATWQAREAMGQTVAVLDPFCVANVPDRLRLGCNLLASIDPDSLTAREDIRVIADGCVMRHDPKHGEWAEARVDVIAGVIAHAISTAPPQLRTLPDVRKLLSKSAQSKDGEPSPLETLFTMMRDSPACGGLARHGGNIGLTALASKGGDGPVSKAVTGALTDTKWIDSPAMQSVLRGEFDLSTLKSGRASVFLVLPPEYLDEHGRFLRLFVLAALQAMMKGGKRGARCLFILDEFFSLGYLQVVEKAVGLLPKNGVHLWPFLQDLGQLVKLYGPHGAETFFGNSDAQIFFGNTDAATLNAISLGIGNLTTGEIGPAPVHFHGAPLTGNMTRTILSGGARNPHMQQGAAIAGGLVGAFGASMNALASMAAQEEMAQYQQKAAMVGRPRVPPELVRDLVGKGKDDLVARSMIVFAKAGDVFNLKLAPYFLEKEGGKPPASIGHAQRLIGQFNRDVKLFAILGIGLAAFFAPIELLSPFADLSLKKFPYPLAVVVNLSLMAAVYYVLWRWLFTPLWAHFKIIYAGEPNKGAASPVPPPETNSGRE